MQITVTHTLSAHFVEVAAASTVQFEHGGVSVTVATAVKPEGGFATITCAGTADIPDDGQPRDAVGTGAALEAGLIMLDPDGLSLIMLDAHDWRYAPAVAAGFDQIDHVLRHVGSVVRWRFGLHGHDALFKDTAITACLGDGRALRLHVIPRTVMGDDRAEIEPSDLEEVAGLVASSQREPVGHELWREAWNLRHSNPRASLVIGVAAAEVGLKQLIGALVPDAKSLVDNIPSPSLDVMMRKVLSGIPVRAGVEPGRRAPRHLRKVITTAAEERNRVVHLGAMPRGHLRETLLVVREFLYLLDAYSGQPWAEALLTQATRAALADPIEPGDAVGGGKPRPSSSSGARAGPPVSARPAGSA